MAEEEDDLKKEVVLLVKELTREVLVTSSSNLLESCACYLERKLRLRDGMIYTPNKSEVIKLSLKKVAELQMLSTIW